MNKKDWVDKEKEFIDMQAKANENLIVVQKQLEELKVFLEAIRVQIKTFK